MNADDMGTQPGTTSTDIEQTPLVYAQTWMGYRPGAADQLPTRALQVEAFTSPGHAFSFSITDPIIARRLALQLLHGAEDLERVSQFRADREERQP